MHEKYFLIFIWSLTFSQEWREKAFEQADEEDGEDDDQVW